MKISLAQWSLHRAIASGAMRGVDFPRHARELFAIDAVELVNTLLESSDAAALRAMRALAADHAVAIPLLMVDDAGDLSAEAAREREEAVDHHRRWIDAATTLGCSAMRVNTGAAERVSWDAPLSSDAVRRALDACTASCERLCAIARPAGVDILLENHGGLSANIPAVVEICRRLEGRNFGTLPDFGNCPPGADPYANVAALMPHARAVSAKFHGFDALGNDTRVDIARMLDIVDRVAYRGWIGIEYEGDTHCEVDGVRAAKMLLERLRPA